MSFGLEKELNRDDRMTTSEEHISTMTMSLGLNNLQISVPQVLKYDIWTSLSRNMRTNAHAGTICFLFHINNAAGICAADSAQSTNIWRLYPSDNVRRA